MILAAVGDTGYNIMLFLHIVLVMVGVAPAFVDPVLASRLDDDATLGKVAGVLAESNMKIFGTALILGGLLGFGVAGMSDGVYKVSDGWLLAATAAWVAMVGLLHGILIPVARKIGEGTATPDDKKMAIAGPAFGVLLLLNIFLMVFKPGA